MNFCIGPIFFSLSLFSCFSAEKESPGLLLTFTQEMSFQTEKELRQLQREKPPVVQLAEDQLAQISTALQEEYPLFVYVFCCDVRARESVWRGVDLGEKE